ncbi:MAG: hypothetical protein LBQ62_08375 [Candidatus Accumulibacter sp.]|jgi:hypothetical protein|nr:hypothetical protein [Accumulibacter sp.]
MYRDFGHFLAYHDGLAATWYEMASYRRFAIWIISNGVAISAPALLLSLGGSVAVAKGLLCPEVSRSGMDRRGRRYGGAKWGYLFAAIDRADRGGS